MESKVRVTGKIAVKGFAPTLICSLGVGRWTLSLPRRLAYAMIASIFAILHAKAQQTAFDASIEKVKICVLGTYHFDQEEGYDELDEASQKDLRRIARAFAAYKPTKVVLERQPANLPRYQRIYRQYLSDERVLDTLNHEGFQIGYRIARNAGHQSIYLFDNKPEFIGSLSGFNFSKFDSVAESEGREDYLNTYKELIMKSFEANQERLGLLSLYDNLKLRNDPEFNNWNAQRMHLYEIRSGTGTSWLGADWLGRWYQRNLRMFAYLLEMIEPGDRFLIVVGDNHKWILEQFINTSPEFELVPVSDFLK